MDTRDEAGLKTLSLHFLLFAFLLISDIAKGDVSTQAMTAVFPTAPGTGPDIKNDFSNKSPCPYGDTIDSEINHLNDMKNLVNSITSTQCGIQGPELLKVKSSIDETQTQLTLMRAQILGLPSGFNRDDFIKNYAVSYALARTGRLANDIFNIVTTSSCPENISPYVGSLLSAMGSAIDVATQSPGFGSFSASLITDTAALIFDPKFNAFRDYADQKKSLDFKSMGCVYFSLQQDLFCKSPQKVALPEACFKGHNPLEDTSLNDLIRYIYSHRNLLIKQTAADEDSQFWASNLFDHFLDNATFFDDVQIELKKTLDTQKQFKPSEKIKFYSLIDSFNQLAKVRSKINQPNLSNLQIKALRLEFQEIIKNFNASTSLPLYSQTSLLELAFEFLKKANPQSAEARFLDISNSLIDLNAFTKESNEAFANLPTDALSILNKEHKFTLLFNDFFLDASDKELKKGFTNIRANRSYFTQANLKDQNEPLLTFDGYITPLLIQCSQFQSTFAFRRSYGELRNPFLGNGIYGREAGETPYKINTDPSHPIRALCNRLACAQNGLRLWSPLDTGLDCSDIKNAKLCLDHFSQKSCETTQNFQNIKVKSYEEFSKTGTICGKSLKEISQF